MKVLGIGYGRHLFDTHTFEHKRLLACADEVESFDHIVFALKSAGLSELRSGEHFFLHPTNSFYKLTMLIDAIRIGSRIIKDKNIDVISAQDLFETGFVALILKLLHPQVRLQVQEHGDVLSSSHWRHESMLNQIRYWFAFRVLEKADVVRVVSSRTENFLKALLKPGTVFRRLPVVIDIDSLPQQKHRSEKQFNTFTFVTAARFVPQKNLPLMINAFAAVHAKHPHTRLVIHGDGEGRVALRELIEKRGLSEVVTMPGWTNDLFSEMLSADAYLLTSNYEGWARVLIESLIARLPIVTTDVGCVNEVVFDELHGLVVPVDELSPLVTAMTKIVSDTDFYHQVSARLEAIDPLTIPGTNVTAYAAAWAKTLE